MRCHPEPPTDRAKSAARDGLYGITMIKPVDLLVRKEGLSHEEFADVEQGPTLVVEETVQLDDRE